MKGSALFAYQRKGRRVGEARRKSWEGSPSETRKGTEGSLFSQRQVWSTPGHAEEQVFEPCLPRQPGHHEAAEGPINPEDVPDEFRLDIGVKDLEFLDEVFELLGGGHVVHGP